LVDATKVYDIAKLHLSSAEETIAHLDNHKYDPNCKFCCDNTFVKDAMRVKELLPQLKEELREALVKCTGIQQTIDTMEGVEDQFRKWKEWTDEHTRLIAIRERLEGDIRTADSKIELLQTQKENVNADIQRYNDNEETITKNQALDIQIQNVRRLKQGVETIPEPLKAILNFDVVEFDWNKNLNSADYIYFEKKNKLHSIGLIAQNIRQYYPEVIEVMSSGYYRISYPKLNAVLVEGIKEQQVFIEDIEQQLIELARFKQKKSRNNKNK